MKMHFPHVRFSEHKPDMRYQPSPIRRRHRKRPPKRRRRRNLFPPCSKSAISCRRHRAPMFGGLEVWREDDDGAIQTISASRRRGGEGNGAGRRFEEIQVGRSVSDVSETNTISLPPAHLVNLSLAPSLGRENGH